jgi:hypothetical protein
MSAQDVCWKDKYHEALAESDKEKLTRLVQETENAMFLRGRQLEDSDDHQREKKEMQAAASDLLAIKIHKLGWPGLPRNS